MRDRRLIASQTLIENLKSFHLCGAADIWLHVFSCLHLLAGVHGLVAGARDQKYINPDDTCEFNTYYIPLNYMIFSRSGPRLKGGPWIPAHRFTKNSNPNFTYRYSGSSNHHEFASKG